MSQDKNSRPTSSPSLRQSPSLFQRSQRYLPGAEHGHEEKLKRRYYHLGVCRAYPPPNDEDPPMEDEEPDEVAGRGLSLSPTPNGRKSVASTTAYSPFPNNNNSSSTAAAAAADPELEEGNQPSDTPTRRTNLGDTRTHSPGLVGRIRGMSQVSHRPTPRKSSARGVSGHATSPPLSPARSDLGSVGVTSPGALRPTTAGGNSSVGARVMVSTRSSSASGVPPLHHPQHQLRPATSIRPNKEEEGSEVTQQQQNRPRSNSAVDAPIAYRPYCTWPVKRSGTLMIPPNPTIVPTLETNNHFVQPNGPLCGGGGTDFSGHFVARPSYSFEISGHLKNGQSALTAKTAADMSIQLLKVQRDLAADWVPNERSRSSVNHTPSTIIERASMSRNNNTTTSTTSRSEGGKRRRDSRSSSAGGMMATVAGSHEKPLSQHEIEVLREESGVYDENGVFHMADVTMVSHRKQRSSMDIVRTSSASHATRMLRLERKMHNATIPSAAAKRARQLHPNQVYVMEK